MIDSDGESVYTIKPCFVEGRMSLPVTALFHNLTLNVSNGYISEVNEWVHFLISTRSVRLGLKFLDYVDWCGGPGGAFRPLGISKTRGPIMTANAIRFFSP